MIPYGDPKKTAPAPRTARHRTVTPDDAFQARNARPILDFAAKPAAAPSSAMGGSVMDLYAPAFRAEMDQRDNAAARLDKLEGPVQRLAQTHGLAIEALEVINIVHRNAKIMGGNPVQAFKADLARATGQPVSQVEAALREAVSKGLLEERNNSYWRSKL